MGKAVTEKKADWERVALFILLTFGIVFVVLILGSFFDVNHSQMVKQQNHSDLINTKEIAALSVSEFVYIVLLVLKKGKRRLLKHKKTW